MSDDDTEMSGDEEEPVESPEADDTVEEPAGESSEETQARPGKPEAIVIDTMRRRLYDRLTSGA